MRPKTPTLLPTLIRNNMAPGLLHTVWGFIQSAPVMTRSGTIEINTEQFHEKLVATSRDKERIESLDGYAVRHSLGRLNVSFIAIRSRSRIGRNVATRKKS